MTFYDLIEKKRNKHELTQEEIDFMVSSFVSHETSDAEMSSLLMAIVLNGMTDKETYYLTKAMQNSGNTITFDYDVVDKHSTGGVGDSTTLVIVPILASLGVKIAKMSGRALGFTGGTIDKVEVFDGYKADKSITEFKKLIQKNNASIISQTKDIAVADKLIYALRDKTATVDSIPLIASSIMSKKLSSGANIILLDVKYGSGAFMKSKKDAIKLAKLMVSLGKMDNKKVYAMVTDMNTPLGYGVGCVHEVQDVIDTLKGKDSRLSRLSKKLALEILTMATGKGDIEDIEKAIASGDALNKLKDIISAQGGNADYLDDTPLPTAEHKVNIITPKKGYIKRLDALAVAKVAQHLKSMDVSAEQKKTQGIYLKKVLGDKVNAGEILATITTNSLSNIEELKADLFKAYSIGRKSFKKEKLVAKIIR